MSSTSTVNFYVIQTTNVEESVFINYSLKFYKLN